MTISYRGSKVFIEDVDDIDGSFLSLVTTTVASQYRGRSEDVKERIRRAFGRPYSNHEPAADVIRSLMAGRPANAAQRMLDWRLECAPNSGAYVECDPVKREALLLLTMNDCLRTAPFRVWSAIETELALRVCSLG